MFFSIICGVYFIDPGIVEPAENRYSLGLAAMHYKEEILQLLLTRMSELYPDRS